MIVVQACQLDPSFCVAIRRGPGPVWDSTIGGRSALARNSQGDAREAVNLKPDEMPRHDKGVDDSTVSLGGRQGEEKRIAGDEGSRRIPIHRLSRFRVDLLTQLHRQNSASRSKDILVAGRHVLVRFDTLMSLPLYLLPDHRDDLSSGSPTLLSIVLGPMGWGLKEFGMLHC
jgi:hypothetical protein